jgi:hypothetical protein
MNTPNSISKIVAESPWRNAYWFARMLLSGDQYGGVGKSKEQQLLDLTSRLELIIAQPALHESEKIAVCKNTLTEVFTGLFKPTAKGFLLVQDLANRVASEFRSLDDVVVFVVSMKLMVAPMNTALQQIPSNDTFFCRETAKSILDTLGETAVGKVVSTWDYMGVRGCLDVERSVVVNEFTKLQANLDTINIARSSYEDNMVLTAFVQEFERRLAQKRKSRAGRSLEDVSTFLFDYYKFSSHPKPDHFQTDIEVDKWFKCKDGWSVGISCKRTLRERWKQVSSADSHALSRYKIKGIWHITTYDRDLSDEKLTMLGQQRQVFYLDENTDRFKNAATHIGMKDYVRPLSRFIDDVRKEQQGHKVL